MATQAVCSTLNALADFQVKALQAINGKFAALQRLAEILEQAADISGFLPNLSGLVQISSIDIGVYENLRVSCPFLNLPPAAADPSGSIGMLQAQVDLAYATVLSAIQKSPLGKLSKLQQKMADFQNQFNVAALGGVDFMACLQAACAAAVTIEQTANTAAKTAGALAQGAGQLTPAAVGKIASTYASKFVASGGQVLTQVQQQKVGEYHSAMGQITQLRDVSSFPPLPLPSGTPKPVAV